MKISLKGSAIEKWEKKIHDYTGESSHRLSHRELPTNTQKPHSQSLRRRRWSENEKKLPSAIVELANDEKKKWFRKRQSTIGSAMGGKNVTTLWAELGRSSNMSRESLVDRACGWVWMCIRGRAERPEEEEKKSVDFNMKHFSNI